MHNMVVGRKTIGHENTCHLLASSTFIAHTFALSSPVIAIGPHHLNQTETVHHNVCRKFGFLFSLNQSKICVK